MATQKFYNVKKRESVEIDEKNCTRVVYKRKTAKGIQERYAVRAIDTDSTKLVKFINKTSFDALKCALTEVY